MIHLVRFVLLYYHVFGLSIPNEINTICNPIKTSNRQCSSASQRLGMAWVFQPLLVNPDKETCPIEDSVWPPKALGWPGSSSRCWSTRKRTKCPTDNAVWPPKALGWPGRSSCCWLTGTQKKLPTDKAVQPPNALRC